MVQAPLYTTQHTVTTHQQYFQQHQQPTVMAHNPFATQTQAFVASPPVMTHQPQQASPFFTNTPAPATNPFATAVSTPPQPFATQPQLQSGNPFSTVPKPVSMVAPTAVAIAPVAAPVVVDNLNQANLESLKQRIRDLESKIRDTEAQIQDQKGANSELRQLLTERASGLASVQKVFFPHYQQLCTIKTHY